MRKSLTVFSTHTETVEFRLYHEDLRRLLGLPVKKGKFMCVVGHEDVVHITFEVKRNKRNKRTYKAVS